MNIFFELFLYFFIYSVIGWCAEIIYCRILDGKFTDRGFLYGPYCPIYGFGGVIILICLEPFSNNKLVVFFLSMVLTTLLEYITSFIMEKLFDAKWWDYSDKPLNINGRVCLLNSILFGIFGLVIIYIVHPYTKYLINLIPNKYVPYLAYSLIIILCVDFATTLNSLINFKEKLKEIQSLRETIKEKNTSKQFKNKLEELKQHLIEMKLSASSKRIMKAFPNLKFFKLNSAFEDLKENFIRQTEQKIEEKRKKKLDKKLKKQK